MDGLENGSRLAVPYPHPSKDTAIGMALFYRSVEEA